MKTNLILIMIDQQDCLIEVSILEIVLDYTIIIYHYLQQDCYWLYTFLGTNGQIVQELDE